MVATATPAPYPYQPFPNSGGAPSFVQELRQQTAGVRLMSDKFGVRRSLSKARVAEAAEVFHAEGSLLSATKKIIDTNHVAYKAVTAIIAQARSYWNSTTVPYPQAGVRLIRRDKIQLFNETMTKLRDDLQKAVEELDAVYPQMRDAARQALGDLFSEEDYPASVRGLFRIAWEFPSVEPDTRLKELHPEIYEQEQLKVQAKFAEAIELAESAFTTELKGLVAHLTDRLTGTDADGKPKMLRASAIENLNEFFGRFQSLSIGSNAELSELVTKARSIVNGVDVGDVRKNGEKRATLAEQLTSVQTALDAMVVDRPERAINRDELGD